MKCQEVTPEFWSYVRGELSPDAKAGVEQHLQSCPDCASHFRNFERVDQMLGEFSAIEPSPYFEQKLDIKLDEVHRKTWWDWGVLRMDAHVVRFGVLFLLTVGIWLGFRNYQARKLNSVDDVVRLQDCFVGQRQPLRTESGTVDVIDENSGSEAKVLTETRDQQIPEEDLSLVENLEILQNLDLLQTIDVADDASQDRARMRKAN